MVLDDSKNISRVCKDGEQSNRLKTMIFGQDLISTFLPTLNLSIIGPFINILVPEDSKCSKYCNDYLFLNCGKKVSVVVIVDDAIKLAHMLLYI